MNIGDKVRLKKGSVVGKVIGLRDLSCKVEWPDGSTGWWLKILLTLV